MPRQRPQAVTGHLLPLMSALPAAGIRGVAASATNQHFRTDAVHRLHVKQPLAGEQWESTFQSLDDAESVLYRRRAWIECWKELNRPLTMSTVLT